MEEEDHTQDEYIESDLNWLKNELTLLTKEQRCFILSVYEKKLKDYGVGVKEYVAFVNVFNQFEN